MDYILDKCDGVLVDRRAENLVKDIFKDKEIIFLDGYKNLDKEIDTHPDIYACPVGKKTVVSSELKNLLNKFQIKIGESTPKSPYPSDVKYNIATVGKYAIGKYETVDNILKEEIKDKYEFLNCKQGYGKCSIVIVDEESIITADKSIAKITYNKIDTLLVEQENSIELGRYSGLIGGCSFTFSDRIVFFGNIKNHIDYKKIKDFIHSKNKEIICLGQGNLKDYGSVVPLYYKKEEK